LNGPVTVLGAGGHGKVVIATLQDAGIEIDAVYDDDPVKHGTLVLGIRVKGNLMEFAARASRRAIIAIGANATRQQVAARFAGTEWITAIHPRAYVHQSAITGAGTVILAGAVIQPGATLGEHVIVNTAATIDHDCFVGDFAHLAPGSHLAGEARVHSGALLGIGAVVAPGRQVGEWAIVGAGAAVVHEIPAHCTAVGVPAQIRPARETAQK
jgi:sugar O-acyltransferase (sialic acid O-acetyltransferase NeuD family)